MASNYYGLPVHGQHGQPAQYTAAATAYPAAPAFVGQVGQTTNTSYARVQSAQAPVAAYTATAPYTPTYAAAATPATSIVASANAAYTYPAAQYPATPSPLASTPYYPQHTIAGATGVTYSAADGSYQARPTYSHTAGAAAPGTYTSAYASTPTTYSYQPTSAVTAAAKPNIYVQPQQAATINLTPVPVAPTKVGTWRAVKPAGGVGSVQPGAAGKVFKGPRIPPKPQQLHYCEVCKISCAGPQTYKEHLEGQKHKKKEASVKSGTTGPTTRGGNALRCELCDVTCTGSDAYAAHIRGAKHQKVVKLHTKLGKPIPSVDPVLVTKGSSSATNTTSPAVASIPQSITNIAKPPTYQAVKQPSVPKITFVGSDRIKAEAKLPEKPAIGVQQEVTIPRLPEEKDVQPVGHDYIEEIKNEEGKVVSFSCKLCECRFNDPNAKEMHMKGRRHRLQYKKKVNPDLVVDIKPSLRQRKIQEERAKRTQAREEFWKRREEEFRLMEEEERHYWAERKRFEEEMDENNWYRRFPGRGPPQGRFGPGPAGPFGPFMMRRPDTVDDRHCVAKHDAIYPSEENLESIQKIVLNTETALKKVSDYLTAVETGQVDVKTNVVVKKEDEMNTEEEKQQDPKRILVGVMRVGLLAKQLLLKGDNNVELVVLCREKPTKSLLEKIATHLPSNLASVAPDDVYEVRREIENACLVVTTENKLDKASKLSVTITLTSPLMRDSQEEQDTAGLTDPPDVLDRDKCISALAELRHVKWFHSRALSRHSCTVVIRILRDLCQRNPTWSPLGCWPTELLVEKVLNSAGVPLSPGDAMRRVFEALAGGILLADSPGFLDPCEKEPMDAAAELTNQEREDITSSAQHALRLIAFRQVHKVLGMESLPPAKHLRGGRKRRISSSGENGENVGEEKKDKRDDATD